MAERQSLFGAGAGPIFLDNVACNGSEETLTNCSANFGESSCDHTQDASVICGGMTINL